MSSSYYYPITFMCTSCILATVPYHTPMVISIPHPYVVAAGFKRMDVVAVAQYMNMVSRNPCNPTLTHPQRGTNADNADTTFANGAQQFTAFQLPSMLFFSITIQGGDKNWADYCRTFKNMSIWIQH